MQKLLCREKDKDVVATIRKVTLTDSLIHSLADRFTDLLKG